VATGSAARRAKAAAAEKKAAANELKKAKAIGGAGEQEAEASLIR
jgi:hypothetical protein